MLLLNCSALYTKVFLLFDVADINEVDKVTENLCIVEYNSTAPQTTPSKIWCLVSTKKKTFTKEDLLQDYWISQLS